MQHKKREIHSITDSNEQTRCYFSRSVLPTELINEVMSYLSVDSIGNLATTSRETGLMVRNWLCTSQAVSRIAKDMKKSGTFNWLYRWRHQNAMARNKIVRFILQVTVILPIEERLRWIYVFVPRLRKVWTSRRVYCKTDGIPMYIAVLLGLAEFATDRDIDIAVESVLKKASAWNQLLSNDCPVDRPNKDIKIRMLITEICPNQRLLLSAVKVLSRELCGTQITHLIYVIVGPCDGKILWMPYVKCKKDLQPLAEFLNLLWQHDFLKVGDLICCLINFPVKWPVKCIAYLFSRLSRDLCIRLPFPLIFSDKSGYERLAEILVNLSKVKLTRACTIFGNLLEEAPFPACKLLALKVFQFTAVLMKRYESESFKLRLRNIVFFGNDVSKRCVKYYKLQDEDTEGLPTFTIPVPTEQVQSH